MDENIRPIGRPPQPPTFDDEPRIPPPHLMTADQYQTLVEVITQVSLSIDHVFDALEAFENKAEQRWNSTVTNNDTTSLVSTIKDLNRRVNRIESKLGDDKVVVLRPELK